MLLSTHKVHETKFFRAGIFFLECTYFLGFLSPFCGTTPILWIFSLLFFKKWEIVTVNHYDKRKFLCRSNPLWRRKIHMSQWTSAMKVKILRRVESPRRRKIPMSQCATVATEFCLSQWTNATKGNYYVTVNHCDKRIFLSWWTTARKENSK